MFAVGLDNVKNPVNVGAALRAVKAFGGCALLTSGKRIGANSAAVGADRDIPVINLPDLFDGIPVDSFRWP